MHTNFLKISLIGSLSLLMIAMFTALTYYNGLLYEVLTNESRGLEILTAIFYIAASGILLRQTYTLFRNKIIPIRTLILPALLGLFFIVVGGEEESWGQWIFELSTPETLREVNYQNEINFHNLDIFTGSFHANVLLYRFVFLYAIIVPFAYLTIGWVRNILDKIGCPVIPVYLTPIFASAFVYRYMALNVPFPPASEVWRHAETAEFIFAVGFLVFIIDRFLKYKKEGV